MPTIKESNRKNPYRKRVPLTESQKQYVRDNHKRQSPKEIAENLQLEKSKIVCFMRFARLASSNEVHGSRDARLTETLIDGCFNVHAKENWLV